MFTRVCIISHSSGPLSPDCVVDVVKLFGSTRVESVSGYALPLQQRVELEDELVAGVAAVRDGPAAVEIGPVAVDTLGEVLARHRERCVSFLLHLGSGPWGERLEAEVGDIVESLGDGCLVWDVFIEYGKVSVPNQEMGDAGRYTGFLVSLCGDGKPTDVEAYIAALFQRPLLRKMVTEIEKVIGPVDVVGVWS